MTSNGENVSMGSFCEFCGGLSSRDRLRARRLVRGLFFLTRVVMFDVFCVDATNDGPTDGRNDQKADWLIFI